MFNSLTLKQPKIFISTINKDIYIHSYRQNKNKEPKYTIYSIPSFTHKGANFIKKHEEKTMRAVFSSGSCNSNATRGNVFTTQHRTLS